MPSAGCDCSSRSCFTMAFTVSGARFSQFVACDERKEECEQRLSEGNYARSFVAERKSAYHGSGHSVGNHALGTG